MKKSVLLFTVLFLYGVLKAQDVPITFTSGSLALQGALSIPSGTGPFPVVVLVHGSGPNDRDQTFKLQVGNALCPYPNLYNDTLRNFRDLAQGFVQQGIAVLRYDKRTFTYGAQLDPKQISPYDFLEDIHAAVDFVKTRTEIDTQCIALLGHSQGANLVAIAAHERTDIAKILAIGTPAQGIDSIMAWQIQNLYYECLNDTAAGDFNYQQTLDVFVPVRQDTANPNIPIAGAYPKFWRDWINITDSAVYHLNQLSIPTLVVHAMDEYNVPLSNTQRIAQLGSNAQQEVYFLPDVNHYLTSATVPTVTPGVIDTLVHWMQSHMCHPNAWDHQTAFHPSWRMWETASHLTVVPPTMAFPGTAQIFDVHGRCMRTIAMTSAQLRLAKNQFPKGLYVVVVHHEHERYTQKIMIR